MCQTPCFTQITSLHPHTNPLRKTMLFPFYRNTESSGSVLGTGAVDESDHLSGERNTALFRKSGTGGHRSSHQWREERAGQEERLGGEEPWAEPSRSRGWSGEARRALPSPSRWREADTGEAGPAEFPTGHTAAVETMGLTFDGQNSRRRMTGRRMLKWEWLSSLPSPCWEAQSQNQGPCHPSAWPFSSHQTE